MIYKFKGHEIEIYDTIQKLPILRFQKLNKYQIKASEVGNTFLDYDKRMEKALSFLRKNMVEDAIKELDNQRLTVYNAFNEISPTAYSFAVLVKRIDKVEYIEFAPDDLDAILKHLEGIGFEYFTCVELLREVKKKLDTELSVYYEVFFPKYGESIEVNLRVQRASLMCDEIINNSNEEKHIYDVEREILERDKPNTWNVWKNGNMERSMEVDFTKFAVNVSELSKQSIEDMTVFKFYATLEYLKEKHAQN